MNPRSCNDSWCGIIGKLIMGTYEPTNLIWSINHTRVKLINARTSWNPQVTEALINYMNRNSRTSQRSLFSIMLALPTASLWQVAKTQAFPMGFKVFQGDVPGTGKVGCGINRLSRSPLSHKVLHGFYIIPIRQTSVVHELRRGDRWGYGRRLAGPCTHFRSVSRNSFGRQLHFLIGLVLKRGRFPLLDNCFFIWSLFFVMIYLVS